MERTRPKQQKPSPRTRKQQQMMQQGEIDGTKKKHSRDNGGINNLPDDVLINILSRLSTKEAVRASLLARRWRYLWMSCHGTLRFQYWDTSTGTRIKFESLSTIRFYGWLDKTSTTLGSWLNFAKRKEVERLDVNLPAKERYEFPRVERLISLSNGVNRSPFPSLITLKLEFVDVLDNVVQYFLANCPNLEKLCIHSSLLTMNPRVVDPPRLKVLEITRCLKIQSLEVSAANLVSLTYGGKEKSLKLKSIPNLRELTISGDFCLSFVMAPKDNTSYSVQLETLVLDFSLMNTERFIVAPSELPQLCSLKRLVFHICTAASNSILYVASLLEACPQVREFRVQMFHSPCPTRTDKYPFPIIQAEADHEKCFRRKIKVVEIGGYIGCSDDDALVLEVMKIGRGSIERVVIDTNSYYYVDPSLETHHRSFCKKHGAATRNEARKIAQDLVSKFRSG